MEIIRGSSLDAKLRAGKPLDAAVTERALREAADGLDFAHRNGIVHRDIKPANILLDESGRVKLVDFGIARLIDQATASANLTAPGTTVGTLGYMPPEQIRGDPVDGHADQFSLGVVVYQMAAGRKPFEADTWIAVTHKIMNVEPDPITKWNPAVKPEAAASIAKALPDERFITCGEFARTFSGEVKPQARKRSLVPMVAAGGLVVALGTAAALWVHCCAAPPIVRDSQAARRGRSENTGDESGAPSHCRSKIHATSRAARSDKAHHRLCDHRIRGHSTRTVYDGRRLR